MPNPTPTPAIEPELIVAMEIPANTKGVKELSRRQTNRGNPTYHYVLPCTYVTADERRFASQLTASKLKDLGEWAETVALQIARGAYRASFLDGKFVGCSMLLSIG